MFGHRYYHETTRRYVAIFGTLFNDIVIERKDNAGASIQKMKVPISYGPVQKFLARLEANPDLGRPMAMSLPRMSFEITGMNYDGERKVSSVHRKSKAITSDDSSFKYHFAPSPYNLEFQLNIMTKYAEDGTKILEQILPFFQPAWTSSVKLVDDFEDYIDIPIILNSVQTEDIYEGDFETRRTLMWTLGFTLKGFYYGPISNKKVIKFTQANLYDKMVSNTALNAVTVEPGLTANGQPTTLKSGLQATATTTVNNGQVTSVNIVGAGSGYTTAQVIVAAPTPTTATGTASFANNLVTGISVTDGGGYYTNTPEVQISAPTAPPVTAQLSATLTGGSITGVSIDNEGLYYIGSEGVVIVSNTGTQATATATIVDEKVSSFTITDAGFGYDIEPVVTINEPTLPAANAQGTAYLTDDKLTSINVSDGGRYYTQNPTVTISTPTGSAITATATTTVSNGEVDGISITENGRYYLTDPAVTISAPDDDTEENPVQATATAVVSDGKVTSLTIDEPGLGYSVAPTVTIENPTGSPLSFVATATAQVIAGRVDSISVVTQGLGYESAPTITIDEPTGGPTDFIATANTTIDSGTKQVTAVNVITEGLGYDVSQIVVTIAEPQVTQEELDADLQLVVDNGIVTGVTILDGGSNFDAVPQLVVSEPQGSADQFNAEGTIQLTDGVVTSVDVDYPGIGYIAEPTVTFDAPLAIQAEALVFVQGGALTETTMTNLGAGYQTPPIVTISAPDDISIGYENINFDDDWDYVVVITDEVNG